MPGESSDLWFTAVNQEMLKEVRDIVANKQIEAIMCGQDEVFQGPVIDGLCGDKWVYNGYYIIGDGYALRIGDSLPQMGINLLSDASEINRLKKKLKMLPIDLSEHNSIIDIGEEDGNDELYIRLAGSIDLMLSSGPGGDRLLVYSLNPTKLIGTY